ncbi:MAG: bacteriohemerythrin [Defluviitaleaceae bacterium]|nr:bacteriohemerythrin [Defluviitaleaceae bacterium]
MWKDSYTVGVGIIDRQHKELFEQVANLKAVLTQGLGFDEYKRQIGEAVQYLKKYCTEHFADEEKYYKDTGIEGIEEHRQLHIKLIQDVFDHEKRLMDSDFSPAAVREFLGFLLTWLIYHVAGEDQKFHKTIKIDEQLDGSVMAFADRAKQVLMTITGIAEGDIKPEFDRSLHISDGVGFKVGLVGGDKLGIGLVYSNNIVTGALKAMTGMDIGEINELAYSALQEISNIVSAKISDVLSDGGEFVDIAYPVRADIADIPKTGDSFLMHTVIGDMEVIVY